MKTFKFPLVPLALFLALFFATTTTQAGKGDYECPNRCVSDDVICCKTAGGSTYFGRIH